MLAALLLLAFIACNRENNDIALTTSDIKQEQKAYATDTAVLPGITDNEEQQQPNRSRGDVVHDWDKKIIKTASLNVEVKDYQKYYTALYASVRRVGGYVAQENQTQSEYKTENVVAIKVPVTQFDEAVNLLINGTGQERLIEKKIGSDDVTGEVVDTKSRLEAKRQVRLRYMDLLKQAKNMGEVLQVQNEINDLQEQIEMAAGRMSYLNNAAAYSTINLTFYQVLNPSAGINTEPSFVVKLVSAFQNGWDFIKLLLLGLISIWPFLILFGGVWLGFKKWRSSRVKTA
jgi:hypothetical protein